MILKNSIRTFHKDFDIVCLQETKANIMVVMHLQLVFLEANCTVDYTARDEKVNVVSFL